MKLMIASDLHGSSFYTRQLMERYREEKPDRLLLLGDLLYHGPRNDLPDMYDPREVIRMLNEIADNIICVRGNCDAEVDQMVLDFPIMADYSIIFEHGKAVYATHGHIFSENDPPKLKEGDILLTGHTHVPACCDHGFWYLNPGSVSIPKNNSWHGYMMLENGSFTWKDLDGNARMKFSMDEEIKETF